jgi:hypothetical protein
VSDIAVGRDALEAFLAPFTDELRRVENRRALESYVAGLAAPIDRKSARGIAAAVEDTNSQRLQEFLTRTEWDARALDRRRVEALSTLASRGPGILSAGVSAFRKRGSRSVGVARQKLPGERARNQQVVVTLDYADGVFEWPVASHLHLPDRWQEPELREAAGIPEDAPRGSRSDLVRGQVAEWLDRVPTPILLHVPRAVRDDAEAPDAGGWGLPAVVELSTDEVPVRSDPGEWTRVSWLDRAHGPRVRSIGRVDGGGSDWYAAVGPADRRGGRAGTTWFRVSRTLAMPQVIDALPMLGASRRLDAQARQDFGLADYEGRLWDGFNHHLALVRLAHARALVGGAYA